MVQRAIAKRLSRQDWVDAALRSTAQVGLENVSVEALAKTLNATKGSFYWHFTDRAE
ncbi:MAG: helix-turn-helix transcriptional regulator, partial [Propionibacteriaceae bacterium]|nr:helix-turn-helix transcriptional regulator [Propionibacteriaceae bacterium]